MAGYYVTKPIKKPVKKMWFKRDVELTQQRARFAKGTEVWARVPTDVPPVYTNGKVEVSQDQISWKLVPVEYLQETPITE